MLLGVVETIVGVGFIHCPFNLLVVGDCSHSNDPTYPSPKSTLVLTSHLGQNVSLGEG